MCPMWLKNVAQKNPEAELILLQGIEKPERDGSG